MLSWRRMAVTRSTAVVVLAAAAAGAMVAEVVVAAVAVVRGGEPRVMFACWATVTVVVAVVVVVEVVVVGVETVKGALRHRVGMGMGVCVETRKPTLVPLVPLLLLGVLARARKERALFPEVFLERCACARRI